MRTLLKVLMSVLLFTALASLIIPAVYVLPGTTYLGHDVSGKRSDLNSRICTIAGDNVLSITGYDNYVIEVPLDHIARVTCEPSSIKLNYIDWYLQKELKPSINIDIDFTMLKRFLSSKLVECKNAYIKFTGEQFELVREQYGFEPVDVDTLINFVIDSKSLNVDVSSLCMKPIVVASDLEDDFAKVNWLNDFSIEYDNGCSFTISNLESFLPKIGDYTDFVKGIDATYLDTAEMDLSNFLNKLNTAYSTKDNSLEFKSSNGTVLNVPFNTFGVTVNTAKEKDFILNCLKNKTSVSSRHPYTNGYDEFDDTYIEVSIQDQHAWFYKDGTLVDETPVVTGAYKRHDTPTGVFYISERVPGKYLIGQGYKTWVNRWMRLNNNGIGLHDAVWRSSFGKQVYKGDGSHGCVNLPKQWAYSIYDQTYVGMPVVIY